LNTAPAQNTAADEPVSKIDLQKTGSFFLNRSFRGTVETTKCTIDLFPVGKIIFGYNQPAECNYTGWFLQKSKQEALSSTGKK
jgi:hypothetical protein